MSTGFEKIKSIDQRQKLTVYGYLRKISNDDITDLIYYVCLIFYGSVETFGKCSKHIKQSGEDNNTVTGTRKGYSWCSAYGKTWIESLSKHIVEWEVKLSENGEFDDNHFGIAIVSNHNHQNEERDCDSGHSYYFCFYYDEAADDDGGRGIYKIDGMMEEPIDKLHREIKTGDTIHFILNMSTTSLYYYLNDKKSNIRVLTNSIKTGEDIRYTFALSMYPAKIKCDITVTCKFLNE